MKLKVFCFTLLLSLIVCFTFVPIAFAEEQTNTVDASSITASTADTIFYDDNLILAPQTRASNSIPFTSKTESYYIMERRTPHYYNNNSNLSNACAPVAASIMIGYYDYTYTNLIPNFDPYMTVLGKLRCKSMVSAGATDAVQPVINNLYSLMGTNSIKPGTNETQFFNGFTQYVQNKGKSLSKSSIVSNGAISFSALDTALKQGKPVLVFTTKFNVIETLTEHEGNWIVNYRNYLSAHIMAVYGYRYIEFTNGSDTWSKLYLVVSSGLSGDIGEIYSSIENTADLVSAYSISIT